MGRRKRTETDHESRPWLDSWWAGVDVNDDSWRGGWRDQRMSRGERDDARRWARRQRPTGGIVRRLIG